MEDFYKWWTEKIKGRYITDAEFHNINLKFTENENNNIKNRSKNRGVYLLQFRLFKEV